ncbi:MAG: hypothetical protein Q9174_004071 [Haloplaca sp. 1 TL-2023]
MNGQSSIMPRPILYRCRHPACPLRFPHARGRYLHKGRTAATWTYGPLSFGDSNPPAEIWDARERLVSQAGSYEDHQMVTNFNMCHHVEREMTAWEKFKMEVEARAREEQEQADAMRMDVDGLQDAFSGVAIDSSAHATSSHATSAHANEGTVDEKLEAALEGTSATSSPLSELSDDELAKLCEEVMENDDVPVDDGMQGIQEAADKMNIDDEEDEQGSQENAKQVERGESLPENEQGNSEGPTLTLDQGIAEAMGKAYNRRLESGKGDFYDDIS